MRFEGTINPRNLRLGLEDGVLTLEGPVENLAARQRAAGLAGIKGVLAIRNKLAVVPTGNPQDHLIARQIIELIDQCACVDVNKVHVEVQDRVVTLRGTVPDLATYFTIYNYSLLITGVEDVHDEIWMWPAMEDLDPEEHPGE